ncbi:agmatine coumaroyltransferase-2 [Zea mays]|jgi:shikimate O-hydroxycinnamoyltransferase|uniref:Spermidine hydroxycinnamoyl transferase n=1 Tax=Zea mays TaxID=4577 RepID=A0A1D6KZF4_MAIZE|nr:agmatine coumaroyltransferase-2 [Zea mays]ONM07753.1 Spermidine hydroxycinnamoyl transferase [Zea mays]|eukprot:XP_020402863.1 agmatine coumaroyltransferase-2 [Zea mays]
MKVKITSSKTVKPARGGGVAPPNTAESVSLNLFDKVTYDVHIAVIYAFRPPNPPNAALEQGLARALAVYREWAGRLGDGPDGRPAVLLNDAGARLVEATVDAPLARSMPFKPSPELLRLHPGVDGGPVEELVQVQLTRFACGSLVVGFTAHHRVADGQATGNFLVAWGLATRRLPVEPLPVRDRATRFQPRGTPLVEFPHRDTEYSLPARKRGAEEDEDDDIGGVAHDKIKVHKVLFTKEFVARLRARASSGLPPPPTHHHHRRGHYSTFESVVGHLWRAVTAARGLGAGETTRLRISVNGRTRMRPPVPHNYFGNMVLWAFPRSDAGELVSRPVQHAADLIHRAVARVDDAYFRSFIDFASSGAVEAEGLAPTADESQVVMCPDLEVDSWLGINFYDLDFGGGCPFYFMPSYLPMEGTMFLLPSFLGDGGIEAYVSLFDGHLEEFKRICYNIA